ncbi:MAG: ATP-dependent helicase [Ruminococcus sp.]|nr:ATP-dependent helicase [Ruminococcus sp.]
MIEKQELLNDLSEEQKDIVAFQGNSLLIACPGSGKTRTLTHKLAYTSVCNPSSHKLNIAITYTNREAKEIEERIDSMDIDLSTIWTGTIHQFCMRFIIRPYAMYSDQLKKGYSIIDEFTKDEYAKSIADELQIKVEPYDDLFANKDIVEAYNKLLISNKEIDFDMILKISYSLLDSYRFICENVSSVIDSIFVDEYQDTNKLQYLILAKIFKANSNIQLLFVGDPNQAIYGTLDGEAKNIDEIKSLYNTDFQLKSLTGCYRSTQRIVNLFKSFEIQNTGVKSVSKIKDEPGTIIYNAQVHKNELDDEIAKIIRLEIESGTPSEEICIVAPQWYDLFGISKKLREKIPDISFDATYISPIKYDPLNPLCLIAQLLFMPDGHVLSVKKKIANDFLTIIKEDLQINTPDTILDFDILTTINRCKKKELDGIICFRNAIEQIFSLLKINIQIEKVLFDIQEQTFQKIKSRIEKYDLKTDYESMQKYYGLKKGVVISTIHGVKGQEYTTVIAFGLLNGKLPHWNIILKNDDTFQINETKKLLYVLCSRAKKNLYLFSECGYTTKSGNPYSPTKQLCMIDWKKI